jgi:thiamine biosynthesis lipoprotein
MNTGIELSLVCNEHAMREAVSLAMDWYDEVERVFSRFRQDSELSRLNRLAGSGEPVIISGMMRDVLQLALTYHETTGGIFSPFVGRSMISAGYDRSFELLESNDGFSKAGHSAAICLEDSRKTERNALRLAAVPLTLNVRMQSASLEAGTILDLGGIVKSWSTAKLAQWLRIRLGIKAGLLNAGGDLQAWNDENDEPVWRIDVQDPSANGSGTYFRMLAEGAVATSGTLGRQWRSDRGVSHHLIDPRTGAPSHSGIIQCTVAGVDLTACEVWAKMICIQGEEGMDRMGSQLQSYDALIIGQHGRIQNAGQAWLKETN